jgi:pimeloyl-ACP methyl ester carboxylesterase
MMYLRAMKLRYLLILLAAIFSSCSYLPEMDSTDTTLKTDRGDYAVYYSGYSAPSNAFLMVPGGLVDPHVYACWIDRLVSEDSTTAVVLMKYPSNLAITNINKAMKVTSELTEFSHWAIGGHSLGGVVAASLVHDHKDFFDGLVLMASWSRESTDLSGWDKPVLSIYASEDQVATEEEVDQNSKYLPPGIVVTTPEDLDGLSARTAYYEITGGNHSGFGCYGPQKGDGDALITPSEQQEQVVMMVLSYLDQLW